MSLNVDNAPETPNEFWKEFNAHVVKVKAGVESLSKNANFPGINVADLRADSLLAQKYATLSNLVLPAFDVRRSQEIIEDLNKEIKTLEEKLKPKSKFKFSSKTSTVALSSAPAVDVLSVDAMLEAAKLADSQANTKKVADTALPPGSYPLVNLENETMTLSSTELCTTTKETTSANVQVFMKNSKHCTFTVPCLLGTVRIDDCHHCTIYLGPCCTSVYLDNSTHCTIFIASHQLRIHTSHNCNLYVRVNSHPIIESCSSMGFAPYTYTYDGISNDMTAARLDNADHWDDVKDFKWHKTTASPNWHVIPEADRLEAPGVSSESVCKGVEENSTAAETPFHQQSLEVTSETAGAKEEVSKLQEESDEEL